MAETSIKRTNKMIAEAIKRVRVKKAAAAMLKMRLLPPPPSDEWQDMPDFDEVMRKLKNG